MYRIIDGRGTGKTSRLMLIAKENNAVFVCSNTKAMEIKAHTYGLTGILFMSYREFNEVIRNKGYLDRNVVIDDLEAYINYTISPTFKFVGYAINED
jgi:hypothetical protein